MAVWNGKGFKVRRVYVSGQLRKVFGDSSTLGLCGSEVGPDCFEFLTNNNMQMGQLLKIGHK